MLTRKEKYRELRARIEEENRLAKEDAMDELFDRVSALEDLVEDLDARMTMMEDYLSEEDDPECDPDGLEIDYIMPTKTTHRKQRGRTAPNRALSEEDDINKLFDDLFDSINLIYRG